MYVRLSSLAPSPCGNVCIVVDGKYPYQTGRFKKNLCGYICVVVDGMYTCNTGRYC